MRKRVIIAVTNDLSIDQRVNRVALTLVEAGWEVLLVGRKLPDSPPLAPRPYAMRRMHLLFKKGPLFYAEYNLRLLGFLLWHRGRMAWANDMDTLLASWLAARLKGWRLVYDAHEYWTEVPELVDRPRTRAIWLWLERRLFPRVDAAMTVNQSIADIYTQQYGIPVAVVRNLPLRVQGVPERQHPGTTLIYQGALNVGRGIELMIAALQHLPGQYRLVVAGQGPQSPHLQAHAKEMGIADRVEFKGHVPFAELPRLTAQAALGMSLEEDRGKSYHYALPNKLFDYIQAGVPALVSDLPEMRAVVNGQTTGERVGEVLPENERTPQALAARILKLCENNPQWNAYHQAALRASSTLCWEREQEALQKILTSLTSSE